MFENGSYLRRRKRFKLFGKSSEEKIIHRKKPHHPPIKTQPMKSSFFIENLLANETNTNTSCTTTSSDTNSTLQQLFYTTDFDFVRKLSFLSDIHGQQQQVYW